MKILWHILVPVAFMTWNFSACGVTINHQINLPGEPLTPQDFENAKIFPSRDKSNEETENCEIFGKELQKSTYQSNFQIWEDGYIPYALDIKFAYNADILERAEIAKAITKLRQLTCIKFITKLFHKDYVFFAKRSGYCGSFIGRQGGEQIVTLNKGCMFEGNILHELLHVVGFEHEQCRIDRDDYIRVSFYNITESAKHNFFKVTPPRPNYAGQYDLLSITHYSAFAFAKHNKLQTLFPFDKVKGEKMGQREELSELDRFKINSYYNCSTKITTMPENSKNSGDQIRCDPTTNVRPEWYMDRCHLCQS